MRRPLAPHRPPIRAYVWAIAVWLIEGEALNVLVTMPGHFIAALGKLHVTEMGFGCRRTGAHFFLGRYWLDQYPIGRACAGRAFARAQKANGAALVVYLCALVPRHGATCGKRGGEPVSCRR